MRRILRMKSVIRQARIISIQSWSRAALMT